MNPRFADTYVLTFINGCLPEERPLVINALGLNFPIEFESSITYILQTDTQTDMQKIIWSILSKKLKPIMKSTRVWEIMRFEIPKLSLDSQETKPHNANNHNTENTHNHITNNHNTETDQKKRKRVNY